MKMNKVAHDALSVCVGGEDLIKHTEVRRRIILKKQNNFSLMRSFTHGE